MRIEDRVDDVDARLKHVAAEVQGLQQMPGIYGAEYGKIRTVLERHDTRFDQLDDTLKRHGEKLGEHDRRFDRLEELISDQGQELRQHNKRFDRIDGVLDEHTRRFDQVDARFDQVDARFDQVDARFGQVDARFGRVEQALLDQGDELSRYGKILDRHSEDIVDIKQELKVHRDLLEQILAKVA